MSFDDQIKNRKDRWLAWITSQVGYHETGSNITKYAEGSYDEKAYGFSMQGQPWCDFFFDYSFYTCFGFDTGNAMLYQTGKYGGAAVSNSASFYRQAGAFYSRPEVGDQAIYAGENHTGAVVAVHDNGTFDCIDGNYSDAVTYRSNLTLSAVSGFGRPNWAYGLTEGEADISSEVKKEDESITEADDVTTVDVSQFNKGDLVSVRSGAVSYDTGGALAGIVFSMNWRVLSQWNDRVVINESEDGTRHIMTPVAAMWLQRVNDAPENYISSFETTPPATISNVDTSVQSLNAERSSSHVVVQANQNPNPNNKHQVSGIGAIMAEKIIGWSRSKG